MSYLFVGDDSSGAYSVALALAKQANCLRQAQGRVAGEAASPCNECMSCKKIEAFTHPDVHLIEPEEETKTIKIGQVRRLIEEINLRPYEARMKFWLMKDADRMNEIAQNAFLKTLEEPPKDSTIILITSNIQGLLPTVLSRCRVRRFPPQMPTLSADALADQRRLAEGLLKDEDIKKTERAQLEDRLDSLILWFRGCMVRPENSQAQYEAYAHNIQVAEETKFYIRHNANAKLALGVMRARLNHG